MNPLELLVTVDFPHAQHVFRAFQARQPSPKLPPQSTPSLEYTWIATGILFMIPVPTPDRFCRAVRWFHAQRRPYKILNAHSHHTPFDHPALLLLVQKAIETDSLSPEILHTPPLERLWKELLAEMCQEKEELELGGRTAEAALLGSSIEGIERKIERVTPLQL